MVPFSELRGRSMRSGVQTGDVWWFGFVAFLSVVGGAEGKVGPVEMSRWSWYSGSILRRRFLGFKGKSFGGSRRRCSQEVFRLEGKNLVVVPKRKDRLRAADFERSLNKPTVRCHT